MGFDIFFKLAKEEVAAGLRMFANKLLRADLGQLARLEVIDSEESWVNVLNKERESIRADSWLGSNVHLLGFPDWQPAIFPSAGMWRNFSIHTNPSDGNVPER